MKCLQPHRLESKSIQLVELFILVLEKQIVSGTRWCCFCHLLPISHRLINFLFPKRPFWKSNPVLHRTLHRPNAWFYTWPNFHYDVNDAQDVAICLYYYVTQEKLILCVCRHMRVCACLPIFNQTTSKLSSNALCLL